jgi:uncharacterized protein (TIGR02246 family)
MATKTTDPKDMEKELVGLEKEYWQAIKDKDARTASKYSDDPCIVVGAQGIGSIKPNDYGAMMAAATYDLHDFELKDVQVRVLNDDVAVLAYKVNEELTVDGKKVTMHAADSSTWVRRDGQWVCALHTESVEGDPFGRDRTGES